MPRVARAFLTALLLVMASPPPALAADPVLPRPTATVTFLERIVLEGTATLSGGVQRIEVVVDIEGSERAFVAALPATAATGSVALEYVFETPGGSVLPNTGLSARFRATMEDGSQVDGPAVAIQYADTRLDWQTLTGEHVSVHWTEGGAAFGERALRIADEAVDEISGLLGVTESDPIDFFVYADRDDFYDIIGPGSRENVGGQAHPEIRTLFANIEPGVIDDPWVGIVIPHELSHLVFDTAVNNDYHFPPRWLNEGVAVYLSEGYGSSDRFAVEDAVDRRAVTPLSALTGQFPTTAEQFFLAYSESVSAVDFLIRRYGEDALYALIDVYAEGVTDDEAFTRSIGIDVAGFEAEWLEDLGAEPPTAHGPVDPPAGPVPLGWEGEAPVASQIPSRSGDPAPSGEPTSAPSGDGSTSGGGRFDPTWLLVLLLIGGAALAGAGLWLQRRESRAPAPAIGTATAPEPPPDPVLEEAPDTGEPPSALADPDDAPETDDR